MWRRSASHPVWFLRHFWHPSLPAAKDTAAGTEPAWSVLRSHPETECHPPPRRTSPDVLLLQTTSLQLCFPELPRSLPQSRAFPFGCCTDTNNGPWHFFPCRFRRRSTAAHLSGQPWPLSESWFEMLCYKRSVPACPPSPGFVSAANTHPQCRTSAAFPGSSGGALSRP